MRGSNFDRNFRYIFKNQKNNIVNANLIKLIDQNMKGFNLKVEMKA